MPRDNPTDILFEPALSRSREYKRAVGYFTSAWISRNAYGLSQLAAGGGKARWITSPHLSESDWNALKSASDTPIGVLERSTLKSVDDLRQSLAEDTLNTIAWMVADGLLDFRIAIATADREYGDFHTKFGVFCDEAGPAVAFIGSMNESERGTINHEVVSVFARNRGEESERVDEFDKMFETLWIGQDPHYTTFTLPEATKMELVRLRTTQRPYPVAEMKGHRELLRPYQVEAVRKWRSNGNHGIFEMATGTGKTISALACIEHVLGDLNAPRVVLVVCPFQHLVDQWAEQVDTIGLPVVRAHESSARWRPEIHRLLSGLELGTQRAGIIVTTYATLTSDKLVQALSRVQDQTMLVADECHYLGSVRALAGMNEHYPFRLGLSATPTRYYDEGGTDAIISYFDGVVYEFGLERAIREEFLVPYAYYPEFVELTDDEATQYLELTAQLSRLISQDNPDKLEIVKRLAIKRARVLNNAESKVGWLREKLKEHPAEDWQFTLVYSGDQIFQSTTELIGSELGIRQHEFTSRQRRAERASILQRFESGDLQVLTAMKCLDEGVDVPPTRTAYFLASSGNPREFIQRRGRILRRSPGKASATIFDAIAVPPESFLASRRDGQMWKSARAALRSQMSRLEEFSTLATNRVEAENAVFAFRVRFDLPLIGEGDAHDTKVQAQTTSSLLENYE